MIDLCGVIQETFGKLLDACVMFVGRSSDQGTWIRRSTLASPANGRDSPIPRVGKYSPTTPVGYLQEFRQPLIRN